MVRQTHSAPREEIVARAVAPVVAELRLVDAADLVAFIRLEQRANLADLLASAAELFFMPGTLALGPDCTAEADWGEEPRITLGLELRLTAITVHCRLCMDAENAGVELSYICFDAPDGDENRNTAALASALAEARIRRTRTSDPQEPLPAA